MPLRPLCLLGTGAAMLVSLQLVGVAGAPLNLTVLTVLLATSGFCQTPESGVKLPKEDNIRAIETGDREGILKAGSSGDRSLVPLLRRHLGNRESVRSGAARAAQVALAKLGETDQLQIVLCSMRAIAPTMSYLGGWFSISEGLRMLKLNMGYLDGRNYLRKPSDFEDGDVAIEGPAMTALRALPKIVPNPPLSDDGQTVMIQTQQSIDTWKSWIEAHEIELKQLKPTGQGIDFSDNACKRPPRVHPLPK